MAKDLASGLELRAVEGLGEYSMSSFPQLGSVESGDTSISNSPPYKQHKYQVKYN
ncbi:hypothetical protein TWF506_002593 [Arthrobotrys conoides]|uniref:Uncharacterized protein n=1 Tax=Arthrobotrys conoides TaxID=74498 RepID=A0AAN8N4Q8_9PEZI